MSRLGRHDSDIVILASSRPTGLKFLPPAMVDSSFLVHIFSWGLGNHCAAQIPIRHLHSWFELQCKADEVLDGVLHHGAPLVQLLAPLLAPLLHLVQEGLKLPRLGIGKLVQLNPCHTVQELLNPVVVDVICSVDEVVEDLVKEDRQNRSRKDSTAKGSW